MAKVQGRTVSLRFYWCTARSKVCVEREFFVATMPTLIARTSFNLPDDVFDANETKPQRKATGVKGAGAGAKKRGPSEVLQFESFIVPRPQNAALLVVQDVSMRAS